MSDLSFVPTDELIAELQRRFPASDDENGPPQHTDLAALVEMPVKP